jgi:hypothetical protein
MELIDLQVSGEISIDFGLLGCNTVRSSALKVEEACSSETVVSSYKFTWRYNPGDQHLHGRENLKSQNKS